MYRSIGIVQARLGSTRLPHKVARRLGGKSLVDWIVRRVSESELLDRVILATTDDAAGRQLAKLVPRDVPVMFGSETDVLGRFAAVLEEYPAESIVRVCADNPFIDPVLIDCLVRVAGEEDCDYLSYGLHGGRPAISSSIGVFAEWVRGEALLQANEEATEPADREHVTRYFYRRPDRFRVKLIPCPPPLDRDDVRLTVDYPEDWEHAEQLFEALGENHLEWQRITGYLERQPALRSRMADLNRMYAK